MSEQENWERRSSVHLEAPLTIEQIRPISASERIYDAYSGRIADFGGFKQRTFKDAREDFEKTIHEAHGVPIEFLRDQVYSIITPESYGELVSDLGDYWEGEKIEQSLVSHSVAILTNHFAFSDLPTLGVAVVDVRQHDPDAAKRNVLVEGGMIPAMEVDLFGTGEFAPATPILSMIARQLRTVPSLPEDADTDMLAQRRIWNEEAKAIHNILASTPGNILLEAGSGTHDKRVRGRIIMQAMNKETAELMCNPRLKVIPAFYSCDSFTKEGLVPAVAKYKFLAPRIFSKPSDVTDTMHEIADAGTEVMGDELRRGVIYSESFTKAVARNAGKLITGHSAS